MSRPRYAWWGYVKAVVRNYPKHHEQLCADKAQSVTASYTGMPHGGGTSRAVECLAIRTLPVDDQNEYDAVLRAARDTLRDLQDPQRHMDLINMVFWRQTHTLQGAALALHIDYETAKRWQRDFLLRVAQNLGVFHPEPAKMAQE